VNNIVFVQARMGSTRLPGKTLKLINGYPLIWYAIERLRHIDGISDVIILTSDLPGDDVLALWCKKNNVSFYRGSEDNVLKRYYDAAIYYSANNIIRATGDNPFVDYEAATSLLEGHLALHAEYSSNKAEVYSSLPDGLGIEIFSFTALEQSHVLSTKPHHFEHVNEYILENKKKYKIFKDTMAGGLYDNSDVRLTVDTQEDFLKAEFIISSSQFNIAISLKELIALEANYLN
jgi:spore coat polysaccharide biosynthesis protein SpsF